MLVATGLTQAAHALYYAFGAIHWRSLAIDEGIIGLLWSVGVLGEVALFAFSGRAVAIFGPVGLIVLGSAAAALRWAVTALDPPLGVLFAAQALQVARQQQRPVEIDDVGKLAHQHGRRHGREVASMQPTMIFRPCWRAAPRERQGLGEAAGLVQLDVDGVVLADEVGRPLAAVGALVGAHRHGPLTRARMSSAPAGRGCSMSSTRARLRRPP
jgi:hypothetical protein